MILHLFPKSQFSEGFVQFVNSHFEKEEHIFVLYTNKKFDLPDEIYQLKNVLDFDKNSLLNLFKQMLHADKIILHNLAVTFDILTLIYLCPFISRKCVWLIWGADLHCYNNPRPHAIDKFVEHMRSSVISHLPVIATLARGDYDLAVKWYRTKAKSARLNYCNEYEINLINSILEERKEGKDAVRILIGNSATQSNQHLEVLNILEKYKDEDIYLYLPLSYGDMEYAKEVKRHASAVFGEKAIFLEDFLPMNRYYEILADMDIAIFNNTRQQALGNLYALLYYGVKVYMRPNTELWDEFVNCEGFVLEKISSVSEMDFEEFKQYPADDEKINRCAAGRYYNVEQRISEWKHIFEMNL